MNSAMKPYRKALLIGKAYLMIEKTRDIYDVCGIHSHLNDSAFMALLDTLDKCLEKLQSDNERA